jgi:hypothetical protein
MTDYILKLLGLDICADTIVGNEMLRGISGGQKKRVTTGEPWGLAQLHTRTFPSSRLWAAVFRVLTSLKSICSSCWDLLLR